MKIAIASDHAGLEMKAGLSALLEKRGVEVQDLGTHTGDSVDYPDFASQVARSVQRGEAALGVLICGTGVGMSIVANKYRGVRAALCHTELEARMARAHNDANVLCLGQRITGSGLASAVLETFLDTGFEGGRHQRRVQKIHDAEQENRR